MVALLSVVGLPLMVPLERALPDGVGLLVVTVKLPVITSVELMLMTEAEGPVPLGGL